MTDAAPFRPSSAAPIQIRSRGQDRSATLEKSFRKCSPAGGPRVVSRAEEAELEFFARLLWRAFPDATSEEQVAVMAAEVLTTEARPINPRTVRNWLRGLNSPHWRYVPPVLAMAGAEAVFDLVEGRSA